MCLQFQSWGVGSVAFVVSQFFNEDKIYLQGCLELFGWHFIGIRELLVAFG
jgi:hypothetical protein